MSHAVKANIEILREKIPLCLGPVSLLGVHSLCRQSWLHDSDMCSTRCMYKQTDAQSEILALKFHRCDPWKSANSLI